MFLLRKFLLTSITLALSVYAVPSVFQVLTQNIDGFRSLTLNKTVSNCIYQTVKDRDYYKSREILKILSESVNKLKYDILEPMAIENRNIKITPETNLNYFEIYDSLTNIFNNINSIQCKKKIKKKGVMKKIKKYMTTEEPVAVKEEKKILKSYEDFDGWTYEHLQLMKQYYREIQQLLGEIRELCPS
jgi:hypothetical protein